MRSSLTGKLAAGFGLCVLLLITVVVFNYTALQKLGENYDRCLKRTVDMELAVDAQHIGENLYLIIANSVINRDMAQTEHDWSEGKKRSIAKLQMLAATADTAKERASVAEAQQSVSDVIHIYEQEMLPLIKAGGTVPGPLADIDARIDKLIADVDRSLAWLAKSESDENQKSSAEFHAVLAQVVSFGLTISLIGVLVAISISMLTTRTIVRPIAELTKAAGEMEEGKYLVELKHKSNDETGVLVNAFRRMAEKVAKHAAELKASNEQLLHETIERKMAAEKLKAAHDELEQRVAERTAELSHVNELLLQESALRKKAFEDLMLSREQLRSLAANLQSVREEERTNIARNIHDDLGQTLTALKMNLSTIADDLPGSSGDEIAGRLQSEAETIQSAIQAINKLCTELRPSLLDHLGLGAAIEWQAEEFQTRTGIKCSVALDPNELIVDKNLATSLFRILQEALENILRHAKATEVKVGLTGREKDIILEISDNGIGIGDDQLSKPYSYGILGMRERVLSWNGDLRLNTGHNKGTALTVVIPLPFQEPVAPPG